MNRLRSHNQFYVCMYIYCNLLTLYSISSKIYCDLKIVKSGNSNSSCYRYIWLTCKFYCAYLMYCFSIIGCHITFYLYHYCLTLKIKRMVKHDMFTILILLQSICFNDNNKHKFSEFHFISSTITFNII